MNSTLKRIFNLAKRYKFKIISSFFLSIIKVVFTLLVPIYIGFALDTFIGINKVDFKNLYLIVLKIFLFILISALASYFMNVINNKLVYLISKDLREEAFFKLSKLEIIYLDKNSDGTIINKIVSDIEAFCDGLLLGFNEFFANILRIIITLMFMFYISEKITIVVIILTPLSLFVAKYLSKYAHKYFKEQIEYRAELSSLNTEMVEGFSTIKIFSSEDIILNRYKFINEKHKKASVMALFYSAAAMPSTRFVSSLTYIFITLLSSFEVLNLNLTIGALVSFLSYASNYAKPFSDVLSLISELQNSLANAEKIFAFIDEKELENEIELNNKKHEFKDKISFENVSFSYDKDKEFIKNLNFSFSKNQKIAVVGETGSGKTTLINLLTRFYEIDSGNIKIDNEDIRNIKRENLHEFFALIFQDIWLKHDSISNNIIYSQDTKDYDIEKFIEIAKLTDIDKFVDKMKDKYNTIIDTYYDKLSQGQKQLISIARLIFSNREIYVLDEATSLIDTRTEAKISRILSEITKNKTTFIIAHRLKTIKEADLILVMKDGKIIEKGKHENLLNKNSYYSTLYKSQFELA